MYEPRLHPCPKLFVRLQPVSSSNVQYSPTSTAMNTMSRSAGCSDSEVADLEVG